MLRHRRRTQITKAHSKSSGNQKTQCPDRSSCHAVTIIIIDAQTEIDLNVLGHNNRLEAPSQTGIPATRIVPST